MPVWVFPVAPIAEVRFTVGAVERPCVYPGGTPGREAAREDVPAGRLVTQINWPRPRAIRTLQDSRQ